MQSGWLEGGPLLQTPKARPLSPMLLNCPPPPAWLLPQMPFVEWPGLDWSKPSPHSFDHMAIEAFPITAHTVQGEGLAPHLSSPAPGKPMDAKETRAIQVDVPSRGSENLICPQS